MSYRDDLDAAQARADALQRRVDELEAAQAAPAALAPAPPSPVAVRGHPRQTAIVAAAVVMLLTGPVVAVLGMMMSGLVMVALLTCGLTAVIAGVMLAVVAKLYVRAGVDEALIVSGGQGGLRVVAPGNGRVLVPLLERADRVSLQPVPVEARVRAAFTADHAPLELVVTAAVRVPPDADRIIRAAERFLGRTTTDLMTVAQQTLESAARAVVAELDAARVRADPARLADKILEVSRDDLDRMGLEAETLTANVVG